MRNENCKLCNRYKSATNVCVYGQHFTNRKDIMVIIDSVAFAQDKNNTILVGQGGSIITKLLNESNILDKAYITPAVKCFTSYKPKIAEIRSCRKYLLEEIDECKPKLIITLGEIAAAGIFNKRIPIKELRQRYFDFEGIVVGCTYSHNVVFLDPNRFEHLKRDLHWILNNLKGKGNGLDYTLKMEQPITPSNIYGLDVETDNSEGFGLDVFRGKLLTVAIANPTTKECVGYNIGHNKNEA